MAATCKTVSCLPISTIWGKNCKISTIIEKCPIWKGEIDIFFNYYQERKNAFPDLPWMSIQNYEVFHQCNDQCAGYLSCLFSFKGTVSTATSKFGFYLWSIIAKVMIHQGVLNILTCVFCKLEPSCLLNFGKDGKEGIWWKLTQLCISFLYH